MNNINAGEFRILRKQLFVNSLKRNILLLWKKWNRIAAINQRFFQWWVYAAVFSCKESQMETWNSSGVSPKKGAGAALPADGHTEESFPCVAEETPDKGGGGIIPGQSSLISHETLMPKSRFLGRTLVLMLPLEHGKWLLLHWESFLYTKTCHFDTFRNE